MSNVLITGADGQLGCEIRELSPNYNHIYFFTDVKDLDITNADDVDAFVKDNSIDVIINCAAYTAVDKAEEEEFFAYLINAKAVESLAKIAALNSCLLVHISTDYVFDGEFDKPIIESARTNPLGIYGASKLEGENAILTSNCNYVIIRTSWLYSTYGNNFVKSIIRLAGERNELGIVADQYGTPTYAHDLADSLFQIINTTISEDKFGIYHFSNFGVCTLYDFAKEIVKLKKLECDVKAIKTEDYPTPATRPQYSVLDKSKITTNFNLTIPTWEEGIQRCIEKI